MLSAFSPRIFLTQSYCGKIVLTILRLSPAGETSAGNSGVTAGGSTGVSGAHPELNVNNNAQINKIDKILFINNKPPFFDS
jgi:hypothetical protein